MNKYSCWSWPYCKRYYITHPWRWFKDLGRNIKDVCMRAKYGFTWTDVWNFDHWFMNVAPNMLRHMADHGSAYPGQEPFDTPEKWHDWLHHIADLIETGNEGWQDEHNEYYEAYLNEIMTRPWCASEKDENGNIHHVVTSRTELDEKYLARAKELAEQGEANIKTALTEMAEHWYNLWD